MSNANIIIIALANLAALFAFLVGATAEWFPLAKRSDKPKRRWIRALVLSLSALVFVLVRY